MTTEIQTAFTKIYENNSWGDGCKSGPGSTLEATGKYIDLIGDLIFSQNIESVVDLGCGDWTFSKHINWSNANYLGIDVVAPLVEKLQIVYGAPNRRRFIHGDFLEETPPADLFIIKDVLHHLSNKNVMKFIQIQLPKCRLALITNDVFREVIRGSSLEMGMDFYSTNCQIKDGESRPILLAAEPFNLRHSTNILSTSLSEEIKTSRIRVVKYTDLWIRI